MHLKNMRSSMGLFSVFIILKGPLREDYVRKIFCISQILLLNGKLHLFLEWAMIHPYKLLGLDYRWT